MRKYFTILLFVLFSACSNSQGPVKKLPHYDLSTPEIFPMPAELREISGITMMPGRNNLILAEQDEDGKLYYFTLGDQKIAHAKFGAKGDYEDITMYNNTIYILRSDGILFSFPASQALSGTITDVKSWTPVLQKGEYEGMFADQANKKLYILCKQCSGENKSSTGGGSIFNLQNDGSITPAGKFQINIEEIEKITAKKRINFRPSALARNQVTNEWFILSSTNGMLVVTDANWKVKDVYPLDKNMFNQPEGIAFDTLTNLYISNEAGTGPGNILKFTYRK